MNPFLLRAAALAAAVPLVAGCATFSDDGAIGPVSALTRERVGHAPAPATDADADARRTRIDTLLAAPLAEDGAVELALLNNRGLQARMAELGIAEAELVRAGRLPNPSFSFGRLRHGDGAVEIDRAVVFDLAGLLTLPLASAAERRRLEAVQLAAADEAVALASRTRRAWVRAVAARELLALHTRVAETADVASAYAQRMRDAGNLSTLARMNEQAFAADAEARLYRAHQAVVAERERLVRLLGLAEGDALQLPDRLPDLPDAPRSDTNAEQTAMDRRLDVQRARRATEALAASLDLVKTTRFIDVLQVGYQNQSESGMPRANGYVVTLELPVFDGGSTRLARAEATWRQAVHETADIALRARSEVREAHTGYVNAWQLARHYRDEVVPLRRRIAEENLLRYNGMLIGVLDLLADARTQVDGATGYVEALRDFWLADDDLRTATTGRSPAP